MSDEASTDGSKPNTFAHTVLPRVFGVFGDPVAHSRSPAMQGAAFEDLGLPHRYFAFHVAPSELAVAIAGAAALRFGGVNLTVPHKAAACAIVDELTARAERIGAVNTLIFEGDDIAAGGPGRIVGENTDAAGFSFGLAMLGEGPCHHAVVLGGGGASRAIVDALVFDHGAEVSWISRTPDELPDLPHVQRVSWSRIDGLREVDVLVNATTVGMRGGAESFPAELPWYAMHDATRIVDVVIADGDTALVTRARQEGLRVQDGRPMLLGQGALALSAWLGVELPNSTLQAMAKALGLPEGPILFKGPTGMSYM